MASTAISAQGSLFSIGTGTGTALTVTAISASKPMRITVSSLGTVNPGDVVTLAAVVGMTQVNGISYVIDYIDTVNKVLTMANTDSTGYTTYVSGGTATPVTYTVVNNIKDFTGFDGSASELDKTNMSSTAKEFALGLVDPGQFSFNVDQDNADAGQISLRAAQVAGGIKLFKLVFPNTNTASFSGYVKKFSSAGGVDALIKASVDIRISGPITWS